MHPGLSEAVNEMQISLRVKANSTLSNRLEIYKLLKITNPQICSNLAILAVQKVWSFWAASYPQDSLTNELLTTASTITKNKIKPDSPQMELLEADAENMFGHSWGDCPLLPPFLRLAE